MSEAQVEKWRCCICGENRAENSAVWGNNPEPFGEGTDRCCDDCNDRFVVPVRIIFGRAYHNKSMLNVLSMLAAYGKSFADKHRKRPVIGED